MPLRSPKGKYYFNPMRYHDVFVHDKVGASKDHKILLISNVSWSMSKARSWSILGIVTKRSPLSLIPHLLPMVWWVLIKLKCLFFASYLQTLTITKNQLTMCEHWVRASTMIKVAWKSLKLAVKGVRWWCRSSYLTSGSEADVPSCKRFWYNKFEPSRNEGNEHDPIPLTIALLSKSPWWWCYMPYF